MPDVRCSASVRITLWPSCLSGRSNQERPIVLVLMQKALSMAAKNSRNQFTAPKRLADGSRGDLRTHCEVFKMTAVDEKDMEMLAFLYGVIFLHGGRITIEYNMDRKTYIF